MYKGLQRLYSQGKTDLLKFHLKFSLSLEKEFQNYNKSFITFRERLRTIRLLYLVEEGWKKCKKCIEISKNSHHFKIISKSFQNVSLCLEK